MLYVHVFGYPRRPSEDIRFPKAENAGDCVSLMWVLGVKFWSFERVVRAFNHLLISPSPE